MFGVAVDVGEEKLVDEFGDYGATGVFLDAPKEHAREHPIAVEPMRIASQVLVYERIASIANILASR
jgi:hypothetical protein